MNAIDAPSAEREPEPDAIFAAVPQDGPALFDEPKVPLEQYYRSLPGTVQPVFAFTGTAATGSRIG